MPILLIDGGGKLVMDGGGQVLVQTFTVNYAEEILNSNPVGFWNLDETSGTTANDSSVNSQDGTFTGTYFRLANDSIVTGLNSSLYQNNENNTAGNNADTFVDILDSVAGGHPYTSIGNNNNYTLEAWIQTPIADTTGGGGTWYADLTIMELREQASNGQVPFSFGLENGYVTVGRNESTNNERIADTTFVADNAIHHVVAVISGDSISFYIDGSLSSSSTFTTATGDTSVGSATANFQIGIRSRDNGNRDTNGWVGMIAGVALYNVALSAPTIASHYSTGSGKAAVTDRTGYTGAVTADSPINWWRLGEANGSGTATDAGSNGDDGTYENSGSGDVGQPPLIMDTTRGYHRDTGTNLVDILDSVAGGHNFTSFGNSDFSLEAWVYVRGTAGSGGAWWPGNTIIELRTQQGSGSHTAFSWGVQGTNRMVLGMADNYLSNAEKAQSIDNVYTLNTIHHFALTCTVTGIGPFTRSFKMYVDGSEVTVGTNPTFTTVTGDVSVGSTSCNLQIGWRSRDNGAKDSNAWNGWLDEVAIYDSVLSSARILAHYNAGVS